jgi:hypothetical protein
MAQVRGDSPNDDGVVGTTNAPDKSGVFGFTPQGTGLRGISQSSANFGIFGSNDSPNAPTGGGAGGAGVFGLTNSPGAAGVFGANNGAHGVGVQGNGPEAGINGFSERGAGVRGHSNHATGVEGFAHVTDQSGIFGMNDATGQVPDGLNRPAGNGVWGHTKVERGSGVFGSVEPGLRQAAGVTGVGPTAGRFLGDVEVAGDVKLLGGDCAEDFDIADVELVEPGTVMVVGEEGTLHQSHQAYDKRVAGVISGAGDFKPGIVLDKQHSQLNRKPIALLGKVYCKVDASYAPIEVGDLLTTAPTLGHAMKASDPLKAFGAVIGKALRPLKTGQGLVPILIALQ